jgi:hypothetical protein
MLFPILITLLSKGVDQLHEILGGDRRFLIPHEILKLAPGLLRGLVDCAFSYLLVHSFIRLFSHPLSHWFMRSFTCSLIHSYYIYLSLIDPSSPMSWLHKGKQTAND